MTREQTDRDTALVAAARMGDRAAFEQLIRRHARTAGHLAGRLVGNREDAEDVVQEAFTNVYLNLHRFRRKASFKTWVLRITLHVAQDHLRRRRRRPGRQQRDVPPSETPTPASAGPERLTAAREEVQRLRQALEQLPPRQQSILLLKIYEGLSYPEIAAVLGTTVGAARVYLALARQSLRRLYQRQSRPGGKTP